MSEPKIKWIHRFSLRLFALMALFLLATVFGVTWQNSAEYRLFLDRRIEESAMQKARAGANGVAAILEGWMSEGALFVQFMHDKNGARSDEAARRVLAAHSELVSVHVVVLKGGGQSLMFAGTDGAHGTRFEAANPATVLDRIKGEDLALVTRRAKETRAYFVDRRQRLGLPLVGVAIPFAVEGDGNRHWAVMTLWSARLLAALPQGAGVTTALLTDERELMTAATQTSPHFDDELVERALVARDQTFSRTIKAGTDRAVVAFSRLHDVGAAVLVDQNATTARALSQRMIVKNALWAWILVLIAVFVSYLAAGQITSQLQALTQATRAIAAGDFGVRVKGKSRGELGVLSASVNTMATELQALVRESVEKTRLENEMQTARAVQETFFPSGVVDSSGLAIFGGTRFASTCGGDWWGHFLSDDGYDVVLVGDASGHGVPAALVTAMVFAAAKSCLRHGVGRPSPAGLLAAINGIFYEAGKGRTTMTLVALVVDWRQGQVVVANGGHHRPLLVPAAASDPRLAERNETSVRHRFQRLHGRGDLIGSRATGQFVDQVYPISAGDKLVLFTDGLLECVNPKGDQYGRWRGEEAVDAHADENPELLTQSLFKDAFAFYEGRTIDDDITVVTIHVLRTAKSMLRVS